MRVGEDKDVGDVGAKVKIDRLVFQPEAHKAWALCASNKYQRKDISAVAMEKGNRRL